MSEYSGRPVHAKLGLKEGMCALVRNAPRDYRELVGADAPEFRITGASPVDLDMVHLFTTERGELHTVVSDAMNRIRSAGMIWISWPKKSSGVRSDVSGNVIRAVCLPLGLVDVKVCAVDETWSALKFVVRKENR